MRRRNGSWLSFQIWARPEALRRRFQILLILKWMSSESFGRRTRLAPTIKSAKIGKTATNAFLDLSVNWGMKLLYGAAIAGGHMGSIIIISTLRGVSRFRK